MSTVKSRMTAEEKHLLCDLHARYELEHAFDRVLSETMVDDPFYLYYPLGIRVSGAEAVKEHWERVMAQPCMSVDRFLSAKEERWFKGGSILQRLEWPVTGPDGVDRITHFWATYDFDEEARRIESETAFADAILIAGLADVFTDESFLAMPGVSRIEMRSQDLG